MNENQNRNYFFIRPSQQKNEPLYKKMKEDKIVGVGWWWDLAQACQKDADGDPWVYRSFAKKECKRIGVDERKAGKWAGSIERFLRVKEGDRVVVPIWSGVWLGTVTKAPYFTEEEPYKGWNMQNLIGIDYISKDGAPVLISKSDMSTALQRTLTGRATSFAVRDLHHYKDEIDKLFELGPDAKEISMGAEKSKREQEVKEKLLKDIREEKNYMQAGGRGLEKLVKELLEVNGYSEVKVLDKRTFPGHADADVEARMDDGFMSEQFLVQVKHHKGHTDDRGVKQLEEIRNLKEYDGYNLYLLSSAAFRSDVIEKAEKLDINLINGEELVDWIYDSLPRLSAETKQTLKIIDVPSVAD